MRAHLKRGRRSLHRFLRKKGAKAGLAAGTFCEMGQWVGSTGSTDPEFKRERLLRAEARELVMG